MSGCVRINLAELTNLWSASPLEFVCGFPVAIGNAMYDFADNLIRRGQSSSAPSAVPLSRRYGRRSKLSSTPFRCQSRDLTNEDKKIGRDIAFAVTGLVLAVFGAGLVNGELGKLVGVVGLMMSFAGTVWSAWDLKGVLKSPNSSHKIVLSISALVSSIGLAKNMWEVKGDYF